MNKIKLYDKHGKPTGKWLSPNQGIHLGVSYASLIEGANNQGYFIKSQLKGMKKGEVIVCQESVRSLESKDLSTPVKIP